MYSAYQFYNLCKLHVRHVSQVSDLRSLGPLVLLLLLQMFAYNWQFIQIYVNFKDVKSFFQQLFNFHVDCFLFSSGHTAVENVRIATLTNMSGN